MESQKDKLEWLEFRLLEPFAHVEHGVFARHGGVSVGDYRSLNVSKDVGDQPDSVKVNRERVCEALGAHAIVFPHQMHGTNVVRITSKNSAASHSADALFTTEKKIAIAVSHADCQGAVLLIPSIR